MLLLVIAVYLITINIVLLFFGLKMLLWVYVIAVWGIVTFGLDRKRIKNYII
jgi:hypothetical protein